MSSLPNQHSEETAQGESIERDRPHKRWPLYFLIVTLVVLFILCSGLIAPVQILFHLIVGWSLFITERMGQIQIDPSSVATAGVCLVAFVGLLVGILTRFQGALPESVSQNRWRISLLCTLMIFSVFGVGIGIIGITHQLSWLMREDLLDSNSLRIAVQRSVSKNNLKQQGIAAHNYHDTYEAFPPGIRYSATGQALHSHWTELLPFIERGPLYERIDQERAWNSPENIQHFATQIDTLQNGGLSRKNSEADFSEISSDLRLPTAHYAANLWVIRRNRSLRMRDVTDGVSNTLLYGEVVANLEPWGQPGHLRDPSIGLNQSPHGFGGPWTGGGTQFTLADGSVRYITNEIDPEILRRLAHPDDGEDPGEF